MSSSAAEYYEVQWRPQGSNAAWSAPAKCSPLGSIAVKGLPRGTQYEFQVRAVSNCGAKSVWVGSNYTVPAAPPPRQPLMPTPTGKSDGVALDWGDGTVPSGDVMYQIDRAPATGAYASAPPPEGDASWVRVATVSATNWTDSVTDTADYWYRVRAISFAGATSPWTVLNAPAKAIISTPEVSAQVDQARADITALDGQATQLRTDVDTTIAQMQVLQGQVGDILQADAWVATTTYPKGDLVQYNGQLFRSLIDGNLNHQPAASTTDANWEYIGNYASLGEAVGANAANVATVQNTVTQQGNTITANSQSITQNAAAIGTKADASALSATNANVTANGDAITAVASDVTLLGAHNAGKTAFVLNQSTVQVDSVGTTLGSYIMSVQAANNAVNARVDSEQTARANGDAANASAITAVKASLAFGANLLINASFATDQNWANGWGETAVAWAFDYGSTDYRPAQVHSQGAQPAGTPSGWWSYRSSDPVPVVAEQRYCASLYYAVDSTQASVDITFLDKTGASVGEFASANSDGWPSDFQNLSTYPRASIFATAPAAAVTAFVSFRAYGASRANPYAMFFWPMLEEATAQQTSPSPWSEGASTGAMAASATQALTTTVTNQDGRITANANAIDAVSVRMPGGTGTVATEASVTAVQGQVNSTWTLVLDANGRWSGIKAQNNGTVSAIDVLADRFSVSAPDGGASTVFSGGNWRVYDAAGTLRVRMGVW